MSPALRFVWLVGAAFAALVGYDLLRHHHIWRAVWVFAGAVILLLNFLRPPPSQESIDAKAAEETAERLVADARKELADKRASTHDA
jgi:hypothetical protein